MLISDDEDNSSILSQRELWKKRTAKLHETGSYSKQGVYVRFFCITAIIIIFYLLDYIYESKQLNRISKNYQRLSYLSKRAFSLKFVIIYTYEEIYAKTPIIIDGMYIENTFDARATYMKNVFDSEIVLDSLMKSENEEKFEILKERYILYNYDDLC